LSAEPTRAQAEEFVPVAGGDVLLWTARSGTGRPVLLASGGPGCCDYLQPVAAMLDDVADVIRFEPRGCGRSTATGPYEFATCIEDIERLREHFGTERWIVGGHSWGADLALSYALAHRDRVEAVLYICGHGFHDDRGWSEVYHRELDARGELQPEYAYPPNREVNRVGNASFRSTIQRPTLLRELPAFDAPTLIVCAGRDIRPNWPAEQLARLLPRARSVQIDLAEHSLWMTHPDELRSALRDFMAEL
jgi:proline iminopeptidase